MNNLEKRGVCDPKCETCSKETPSECITCIYTGKPPVYDKKLGRAICQNIYCHDEKYCQTCDFNSPRRCFKCIKGTFLFQNLCYLEKCPENSQLKKGSNDVCQSKDSRDTEEFKLKT